VNTSPTHSPCVPPPASTTGVPSPTPYPPVASPACPYTITESRGWMSILQKNDVGAATMLAKRSV
jgi:hypothetical protein